MEAVVLQGVARGLSLSQEVDVIHERSIQPPFFPSYRFSVLVISPKDGREVYEIPVRIHYARLACPLHLLRKI